MAKRIVDITAEKLLNTPDVATSYDLGYLELWSIGDKLRFHGEPIMFATEVANNARVDTAGKLLTEVKFTFTGLQETLGLLTKIIIYYERTTASGHVAKKDITLDFIQKRPELVNISTLEVNDVFEYTTEIEVAYSPATYYNFYAVYIDGNNKVSTYQDKAIISIIMEMPFYGLNLPSNLLEVKDLTLDIVTTQSDIDNIGYRTPIDATGDSLILSWFDLASLDGQSDWDDLLATQPIFKDTLGNTRTLKYEHIKRLQYYVVYMFRSDNENHPNNLSPSRINLKLSNLPLEPDPNGTWTYLGKTVDNQMVVEIPSDSLVSFWVGFKIRNVV